MVHISDGVLQPQVWISGFIITGLIIVWTLTKMRVEDVPKLSVVTAAVFVASLIHFPVGPTSVHLVLNGFAGVMLGIFAYPAIFIALILQAVLFQHGGITTIGINAINMGVPALLAAGIFRYGMKFDLKNKETIFGAIAGGIGVAGAVLLLSIELLSLGEAFETVTVFVAVAHIPVIVIEAVFTGALAGFLAKVKPEILEGIR
ncbi:cobalt transporter CbiM [Methanosarcinales archaeon]|nr:cobalt transporter CbiM [Candidatus Syntrophoarchaeum sp.]RLG30393.1 MAG: cobalt transporter CbiM [Methanosarcinales archaeon]